MSIRKEEEKRENETGEEECLAGPEKMTGTEQQNKKVLDESRSKEEKEEFKTDVEMEERGSGDVEMREVEGGIRNERI